MQIKPKSDRLCQKPDREGGRQCEPAPSLTVRLLTHLIALAFALTACKREERSFRVSPPNAATINTIRLSDLQPGPRQPDTPVKNGYEENAYAVSEGKTLYQSFNCVGCHFQGGGGIGPALMDEEWIYGSKPEQIFATIVEGRPNGMPSFRGRIPDYQVWQIVAYVRSMSGQLSKDVSSGRDDHMQTKPAEQSTEKKPPQNSTSPKSAEQPK